MPYLAREGRVLPRGPVQKEIEHLLDAGGLEQTLFILPTGGWARQLMRHAIEFAGGRTLIQPKISSLQEFIAKLAGNLRPYKRLVSDAEMAVLVELSIRDLFRSERLTYYEERATGSSYPLPRGTFELIVAAIGGLERKGVRPRHLVELLEKKQEQAEGLKEHSELRKIRDLALIYQAYSNRLGTSLTDTYGQYFDLLDAAPNVVAECLSKAYGNIERIHVSGFTSLDEPALTVLNNLDERGRVSVIYEVEDAEKNPVLFKLHRDLIEAQQAQGFHYTALSADGQSPLRAHLDDFLFNESRPLLEAFDASSQIAIRPAADRYEEVRFAAHTVKERIRFEGTGYDISRIAVVMFDQEGYSHIIRQTFKEYGIPTSLTERLPLASSPLFVAVDSLLRLAERGLSPHLILRLLSTPYLEFSVEGAAVDRNNLFSVIHDHRLPPGRLSWQDELATILTSIEAQIKTKEDELDIQRLEAEYSRVRRAKADSVIVESLIASLRAPHTPKEFVALLRKIFYEHGLSDKLLSADRAMLRADALAADTRSYQALDRLLDEFLLLLEALGVGAERLPISYYGERLRVAALKMRYAPHLEPGRGVLVTSIEQVIGMDIDHLVVLGMNDGVFPQLYAQSALLPREHHTPEYHHLGEQRYLFYQLLSTPSRSVHLSYESSSADGEQLPSPFVRELQRIVAVTDKARKPEQILSAREFLFYYGSSSAADREGLLSRVPASLRNDINWQVRRSVTAEQSRLEAKPNRFNGHLPLEELAPEERQWLEKFRSRVYSVSQLETYAVCPFKYFTKYVLGLGETEIGDHDDGLTPANRGNILHDKLRRILEHIRELQASDPSLDHRTMSAETFRSYDPAPRHDWEGIRSQHPFWRLDLEATFETPHTTDLFERFLEEERKLSEKETGRGLRPVAFEQKFPETKLLHPESGDTPPIRFRGTIDRIDFDAGTGNLVVVDYKTKNAPKIKDIEEGLSLQLPVYLRIAEDLIASHTGVRGVAAYYHTLIGKDASRSASIGAQDFLLSLVNERPRKGASVLKHPQDYEALRKAIDKTIAYAYQYVEGMTEGLFPLIREDRMEKCSYCAYRRACRVNEAADNGALPKAPKKG